MARLKPLHPDLAAGGKATNARLDTTDAQTHVDLEGVFYGVRAQIPAMLRAGGGVIVSTSSIAGQRGLWGMLPYSAAKHGVIGMVRTIAWEG